MKISKFRKQEIDKLKKRAKELYSQNLTTREVGDIIGRSHTWVAYIVLDKPLPYKNSPNFYQKNNLMPQKVMKILYEKIKGKHIDLTNVNITKETKMKQGSLDRYRELVRIRDEHTCQWCNKQWEKGRRLDVHHIDGTPEDTRKADKNFDNMITLCHKCHLSIDSNKMPNWDAVYK